MAKPYPSRTQDYNSGDQVASADLNSIQDGIIACSDAIGDKEKTLRIVPWGEGNPLTAAGGDAVRSGAGGYTYLVLEPADVNAHVLFYGIDKYLALLGVETLTRIRMYFQRGSASASLSLALVKEKLSDGSRTVISTLTATDSSGSWVSEQSGVLSEAYDFANYMYYLDLSFDANAAASEIGVRAMEVDYELD